MSVGTPSTSAMLERRRWEARRRWSRAGLSYVLMLLFSLLFLGPLLFAALSSVKSDPLTYPPSLVSPQLSPANWATAAKLGRQGANAPLWGGFAPGAAVTFTVTYFAPAGTEVGVPQVVVPRRRPGGGLGAVQAIEFAADYATVDPPVEVSRHPGNFEFRGEVVPGEFVTYRTTVRYPGEGPMVQRLPLDVQAPSRDQVFVSASLPPTRLERLGLVASFDQIAPGALGYLLGNYRRVFDEARSVTTGQSLFLKWTLNTFIYAFFRVLLTLFIATLAGYALARLVFVGRGFVFLLVLFAQMIPTQVLFISNYLVLRDGVWGLSQLWGQATMLNSLTGLLFVTALNAGPVFIMKQFYESIPREVEEAEKVARHALAEVRSAVSGIRATDLAAELASARLLLESSQVHLDYDRPPPDLPEETERALSLILREATTNISRHAGASRAKVEFRHAHASVLMIIGDDGRGGIDDQGNGLRGMHERVRSLGGTMEIHSPRHAGTTLRVKAPVPVLRLVPGVVLPSVDAPSVAVANGPSAA